MVKLTTAQAEAALLAVKMRIRATSRTAPDRSALSVFRALCDGLGRDPYVELLALFATRKRRVS